LVLTGTENGVKLGEQLLGGNIAGLVFGFDIKVKDDNKGEIDNCS
jgi:hypothetical protein